MTSLPPLTAWRGEYATKILFNPGDKETVVSSLAVHFDSTVTLDGAPVDFKYESATSSLTILEQTWKGIVIPLSRMRFQVTEKESQKWLELTGDHVKIPTLAPFATKVRVTASEINGIVKAYGFPMDEATCAQLAAALPEFSLYEEANHLTTREASTRWTFGAVVGGIVGAAVVGTGVLVLGPEILVAVSVVGIGTAIGSQFGAGWALQSNPQELIDSAEQSNLHGCCVDVDGNTYSVGFLPWLGDLKGWRNYDPATISGVGILVGVKKDDDGGKHLYGRNLQTMKEEILSESGDDGHYSWVYDDPSHAIIYKWNSGKAIKKGDYIRHSQLGGGDPVVCAGEWTLSSNSSEPFIGFMIATINDSSGHYRPDGGKCMGPVLAKLKCLGLETDKIDVTTV